MKVATAVGELQTEYTGRVDFNVISAEETAQRGDEIAEFGFTELKHGLVAFDAAGEALVTMPGHNFKKEDIRAAVEQVLEAGG